MRTTSRSTLRRGVPALVAVAALTLAACGGEDETDDGEATDTETGTETDAADGDEDAGDGSDGADGSIVVGGANFSEMQIMQEMYAALLRDAGYEVEIVSADNREIYAEALQAGELQVVPDYAATMAEYLNREVNGPDAEPVATPDAAETVEAMGPLAEDLGLAVLEPAEAANQNGFAILESVATENDLATLTDLADLGEPVVLAATEECPERPFCEQGLEGTYGLDVTEVLPLGFGSPQAKEAVVDGEADLALTGTTDATLDDFGLVLLEDDQDLQQADNLVPVVDAETAEDQVVVDALNSLSEVLTTEDLTELNRQVDADRQLPEDVAVAYLEEAGLLAS